MTTTSSIAFIGAGRLAQCLAPALAAAGWPVLAVGSRRSETALALAARLPDCQALPMAQAAATAELVFITTPDDAIADTVAALPWRRGQMVVHCSGATPLDALDAARAAGALAGGFHPLQIFSDPESARALLAGTSVAIEAEDEGLRALLHRLAHDMGMKPFGLPAGSRAAYHAAANLAASFMLSLLDEACQVWAAAGLPAEQALQALLPLSCGTLAAAQQRGLAGALSGPISRGDAAVVAGHLQALQPLGHADFYRQLALRQLSLAEQAGRLDALALARLRQALSHKR
ncbi:Rossmann-like and DUF2520 domain-containing protein [Paucibacter soli]|uniref:Rossmann-like and DUF2520 domain-containing protein n=1 Tax=Paucibacter soli TaxID=3133433 RepID=UPI00309695C9